MADRFDELRAALAAGPTPGPWRVQDGCSWRRIGTNRGDGDVVRPTVNRHDGWPDLAATQATLAYIAAAGPDITRALLAERDRLRETLEIIARTVIKPGDEKAALLLASTVNLAAAALAHEQGGINGSTV